MLGRTWPQDVYIAVCQDGNDVPTQRGLDLWSERALASCSPHSVVLKSSGIGPHASIVVAKSFAPFADSLMHLDLSHNALSDIGVSVLVPFVISSAGLRSLCLRDTGMTCTAFKTLADCLIQHNNIQELDISSTSNVIKSMTNLIDIESAKFLADALCKNRSLLSLDLSGVGLCREGLEGLEAFVTALCYNRSLTTLKLDRNQIGSRGFVSLAQILTETESPSLRTLSVSRNGIGRNLFNSALCGTALANLISVHACPQSTCSVSTTATPAPSCRRGYLRRLCMSHNPLSNTQDGIFDLLASALRVNTSLAELDVSFTNCGDAGAELLSAAMLPSQSSPSFNQSIVALRLAGNGLTDSGVAALALVIQRGRRSLSSALETNDDVDDAINCSDSPSSEQHAAAPLRLLNLSYNSIGINGARALARCLGSNDSDFPDSICMLRALNVAGCRLDDASAEVLSQAIGAQLTNLQFDDSISVKIGLRVLNISDNLFTPVGLSTLSQQLSSSRSLCRIVLGEHARTNSAAAHAISQLCQRNTDVARLQDEARGHDAIKAHELNAAAAADALQRTVARSHRIVNRMASQSRLDPLAEGAEKARAKQKKVRALQVPTIEVDAAAIQEARLRIARRHELAAELERDGHARLVAAQQQLAAQQRLRQELQLGLDSVRVLLTRVVEEKRGKSDELIAEVARQNEEKAKLLAQLYRARTELARTRQEFADGRPILSLLDEARQSLPASTR